MPIIGWQGKWANTLRLWGAHPTELFDLEQFNSGDHTAAAAPEALARTLSRVLYPEDTTDSGKELRLKQEFFLTSAALQDILRRFLSEYDDLNMLQDAKRIAQGCLNYTNHTLLPEALETWSTWLMGRVLPRHMQIIERIDAEHLSAKQAHPDLGIVRHDQVHMGPLAFVMASHVNGVSALHTQLMQQTVFAGLHAQYPDRIVNQTNGVTPRRWLRLSNPALSKVLHNTIGTGWAHETDRGLRDAIGAAKRENKVALSNWSARHLGVALDPDAMFDIQIKRMHEYKRQLMNIFETIARWSAIRANPQGNWTPRVKIFGGKAAPGYFFAKDVIRFINDVAHVINNDPVTGDLSPDPRRRPV